MFPLHQWRQDLSTALRAHVYTASTISLLHVLTHLSELFSSSISSETTAAWSFTDHRMSGDFAQGVLMPVLLQPHCCQSSAWLCYSRQGTNQTSLYLGIVLICQGRKIQLLPCFVLVLVVLPSSLLESLSPQLLWSGMLEM